MMHKKKDSKTDLKKKKDEVSTQPRPKPILASRASIIGMTSNKISTPNTLTSSLPTIQESASTSSPSSLFTPALSSSSPPGLASDDDSFEEKVEERPAAFSILPNRTAQTHRSTVSAPLQVVPLSPPSGLFSGGPSISSLSASSTSNLRSGAALSRSQTVVDTRQQKAKRRHSTFGLPEGDGVIDNDIDVSVLPQRANRPPSPPRTMAADLSRYLTPDRKVISTPPEGIDAAIDGGATIIKTGVLESRVHRLRAWVPVWAELTPTSLRLSAAENSMSDIDVNLSLILGASINDVHHPDRTAISVKSSKDELEAILSNPDWRQLSGWRTSVAAVIHYHAKSHVQLVPLTLWASTSPSASPVASPGTSPVASPVTSPVTSPATSPSLSRRDIRARKDQEKKEEKEAKERKKKEEKEAKERGKREQKEAKEREKKEKERLKQEAKMEKKKSG